MTQDSFPITPSSELVEKWYEAIDNSSTSWKQELATQAAHWGADEELEACCEWLHWQNLATHPDLIPSLRAARRPKPPSLKERALKILEEEPEADDMKELIVFDTAQVEIIRRALEALPE